MIKTDVSKFSFYTINSSVTISFPVGELSMIIFQKIILIGYIFRTASSTVTLSGIDKLKTTIVFLLCLGSYN